MDKQLGKLRKVYLEAVIENCDGNIDKALKKIKGEMKENVRLFKIKKDKEFKHFRKLAFKLRRGRTNGEK